MGVVRGIQWGLGAIAIIVPFGLLAFVFGGYGHLALTLMMNSPRPEPVQGVEIAAAAMNVAMALASGATCVLRLAGRPVARWAGISLGMAIAAVVVITAWRPHYYTLF